MAIHNYPCSKICIYMYSYVAVLKRDLINNCKPVKCEKYLFFLEIAWLHPFPFNEIFITLQHQFKLLFYTFRQSIHGSGNRFLFEVCVHSDNAQIMSKLNNDSSTLQVIGD